MLWYCKKFEKKTRDTPLVEISSKNLKFHLEQNTMKQHK